MIKETFAYHNYRQTRTVQSKIDPDATHTECIGTKCPNCYYLGLPEIDHGETVECGCGAELTVHGNALKVRISEDDLHGKR